LIKDIDLWYFGEKSCGESVRLFHSVVGKIVLPHTAYIYNFFCRLLIWPLQQ